MAGTSIGRSVCCRIYGCYPPSCPQRRTHCKTCSLYCPWYRYEREKRRSRYVCRGKRKCQVLALYHERTKEPRSQRYPDKVLQKSLTTTVPIYKVAAPKDIPLHHSLNPQVKSSRNLNQSFYHPNHHNRELLHLKEYHH